MRPPSLVADRLASRGEPREASEDAELERPFQSAGRLGATVPARQCRRSRSAASISPDDFTFARGRSRSVSWRWTYGLLQKATGKIRAPVWLPAPNSSTSLWCRTSKRGRPERRVLEPPAEPHVRRASDRLRGGPDAAGGRSGCCGRLHIERRSTRRAKVALAVAVAFGP